MTNMDALTIPAAGGVDTTAIIIGDFSNGNDGIVLQGRQDARRPQGPRASTSSSSPCRTTCWRALSSRSGLTEKRREDRQHVGRRHRRHLRRDAGHERGRHLEPAAGRGAEACRRSTEVFDSSKIPGEIMDLMVVNTQTLKDNPELGKALVGAWYETMALMQRQRRSGRRRAEAMAKARGTDLAGFEAQLDDHAPLLHAAGRRSPSPRARTCRPP